MDWPATVPNRVTSPSTTPYEQAFSTVIHLRTYKVTDVTLPPQEKRVDEILNGTGNDLCATFFRFRGKGGGRGGGRANLFLPPTVGGAVVGGAVVAFVALLASLDGAKNVA